MSSTGNNGKSTSGTLAEYGQKQRILPRKNGKETPLLHHSARLSPALKKTGNLFLIFLPIQSTGHVEQRTAGQQSFPGMFENLGLQANGLSKALR